MNEQLSVVAVPDGSSSHTVNRPPDAVFHWVDSLPTGAEGWIVLDRIVNQVAGGGIFMHRDASLQEVVDIARNMSRKFTVTVPQIGGAKAGIRFNHKDPRSSGVLRRFLVDNACLLQNLWVTAGDLNTDDRFIEEVIQQELGLQTYQEALAKRLERVPGGKNRGQTLTDLVGNATTAFFPLIGACVGHGVARSIDFAHTRCSRSPGRDLKVAIQGFGVVGSSLAYYLQTMGYKVVSVADKYGYLHRPDGLDIKALLAIQQRRVQQLRRERAWLDEIQDASKNIFNNLSDEEKFNNHGVARNPRATDRDFLYEFLAAEPADVFSPCALRYQITDDVADHLIETLWRDSVGPYLIGGANNMFGVKGQNDQITDDTRDTIAGHLQQAGVVVVPDWVSNSGTAQLFHRVLSMDFDPKDPDVASKVLEATFQPIGDFLDQSLHLAGNDPRRLFAACNELAQSRLENPVALAFTADGGI